MKKMLLILAATFVFISSAVSAVVTDIEFTGLKRTKLSWAKSYLTKFVGKDTSEFKVSDVESELQLSGLFSTYKVEIPEDEENNAIIKVEVSEKLYFMPVPFVMYSSDGFRGGLFVMNMNAFGVQDMFVSGVHGGVNNFNAMAVYMRTSRNGLPGFVVNGSVGRSNNKISTLEDKTLFDFDDFKGLIGTGVNYKLGEYLFFTAGAGWQYSYLYDNASKDHVDGHIFNVNAGVSVNSVARFNGFFPLQSSIGVEGYFYFHNGHFWPQLTVKASATDEMFHPRLVWKVNANYALIDEDAAANLYFNKMKVGISMISGDFKTDSIGTFVAGLEFAFLKIPFGIFALYGNYEFAVTHILFNDNTFKSLHGLGGGIKMYLSKIAIPALSVGCTYNFTVEKLFFAFSIGVAM